MCRLSGPVGPCRVPSVWTCGAVSFAVRLDLWGRVVCRLSGPVAAVASPPPSPVRRDRPARHPVGPVPSATVIVCTDSRQRLANFLQQPAAAAADRLQNRGATSRQNRPGRAKTDHARRARRSARVTRTRQNCLSRLKSSIGRYGGWLSPIICAASPREERQSQQNDPGKQRRPRRAAVGH